jgi:hypothetical protein
MCSRLRRAADGGYERNLIVDEGAGNDFSKTFKSTAALIMRSIWACVTTARLVLPPCQRTDMFVSNLRAGVIEPL